MSSFKKLLKRAAPSSKKLTPQFVKDSKILSKSAHANLAYRAIYQNERIAKAPDWKDTEYMRTQLREEHELSTTPGSKTSNKIYERDRTPYGPERDRLTAEINEATRRRGITGATFGLAFLGASSAANALRGPANEPPADFSGSPSGNAPPNIPVTPASNRSAASGKNSGVILAVALGAAYLLLGG